MNFSFPNVTLIYGRQGQGKSVLANFLITTLKPNIDHFYVLGRNSLDSVNNFNINATSSDTFIFDEINKFRLKPGIKLLIMDDIMHIPFANGIIKNQINDILSTSRHDNMYVIICCHMVKAIGKIFRSACHNFVTFSLDEDSLDLISYFIGEKKSKLRNLRLLRYQFIFTNLDGTIKKMSINTKNLQPLDEKVNAPRTE